MTRPRNLITKFAPHFARRWRHDRLERQRLEQMEPFGRMIVAADASNYLGQDPGPETCIRAGLEWVLRAQAASKSADGGVARHYSLLDGWAPSYPETTGYIIPTLIREADHLEDDRLRASAKQMLDWLVSIQFPEGGFQGGVIGEEPRVPVTFNTGQILLGLAAGAERFAEPKYTASMQRAADWLVATQDGDGCWRNFPTPFAEFGEKAYETHVAWGLFEADRVSPERGYGDGGLRQVSWALSCQRDNGWFDKCCLSDESCPLTHTIGYVLRGLIEAFRWNRSPEILVACEKTAFPLIACMRADGYLAARLDSSWRPAASYACLTGIAQLSICWLMLYQLSERREYLEAARRANQFVRRTVPRDVHPGVDGGVRGSFPVTGAYGQFQFLNWAAKFMIDANRLELDVLLNEEASGRVGGAGN